MIGAGMLCNVHGNSIRGGAKWRYTVGKCMTISEAS